MNILISACLLGIDCRYCGDGCYQEKIAALKEKHHLIPVCPEILGGLTTPRAPSEIVHDKVINNQGKDVTAAFQRGAQQTLKIATLLEADCAILKKNSPSCGFGQIYDGTFSGHKIRGNGITASLLHEHGFPIGNEDDYEKLIKKDVSPL